MGCIEAAGVTARPPSIMSSYDIARVPLHFEDYNYSTMEGLRLHPEAG